METQNCTAVGCRKQMVGTLEFTKLRPGNVRQLCQEHMDKVLNGRYLTPEAVALAGLSIKGTVVLRKLRRRSKRRVLVAEPLKQFKANVRVAGGWSRFRKEAA